MNGWQDENIKWFVALVYAGLGACAIGSYVWWRVKRHLEQRRVPRACVVKER